MKSNIADPGTRVYCARIVPTGSQPIVRLTGYPTQLVMSNGETYQSTSGYEFSGISGSSDMSGAGVDLDGILQAGAIDLDDIVVGAYDNARVHVFATTFTDPIEDEEEIASYFFGKVDVTDEKYRVQLMSLADVLSQKQGRSYSPNCPWTLFDQHLGGNLIASTRSRCTGPRSDQDGPQLADYLVTGTLTAVTDQYSFADSTRAEPDDWFGYGEIQFTTGANAGLRATQIKAFGGGVFTLHEALPYAPQVGDEYQAIPGCRKRLQDCRDKFGNAVNRGAFDEVPSRTEYTQRGRGA